MSNKSHKKKSFSEYKNNYTLNEIVLNFNPIKNPIESYKQIVTTPTIQKYNNYNNYNNSFEHKLNHNIPVIKLNPIKLKKIEKNSYNILYQNLNTINTIPFVYNKRNKTKNKFMKELAHYLNDNTSEEKKENKEHNNKNQRISLSQRYQKNKPILPLIKSNNIGIWDKISQPILTEANNKKNTRNRILFNMKNSKKNGLVDLRNNIRKDFGNLNYKDKYKLSLPNSYKKYNISIFKGIY